MLTPGISKLTGTYENSIKTKRASIEIHSLMQYAWDNNKFSGRQIFEITYNFKQQMAVQSGKI